MLHILTSAMLGAAFLDFWKQSSVGNMTQTTFAQLLNLSTITMMMKWILNCTMITLRHRKMSIMQGEPQFFQFFSCTKYHQEQERGHRLVYSGRNQILHWSNQESSNRNSSLTRQLAGVVVLWLPKSAYGGSCTFKVHRLTTVSGPRHLRNVFDCHMNRFYSCCVWVLMRRRLQMIEFTDGERMESQTEK